MRQTPLAIAIAVILASPPLSAQETDRDGTAGHTDHTELERITVRALPLERSQMESAQPVDVLTGEELDDKRGATLGETLATEPGVHNTFFGQGAGRPVIRGLGGNRVRMQEDGLSTADASAASADHAVTIEPLLVDRIEILRGPATLLYGSGAVGGVVNVIDNRVPERIPDRGFEGRFEVRGNTVADEKAGVIRLDGGGGNFAWHVDGSWRDAGDYDIPGFAELGEDHEHENDHDHDDEHDDHAGETPEGIVPNSFVETRSGTVGGSWIGERGFIGLSFRGFDTEYGVPGGHGHGEEEEEDDHDDDHGDEHGEEEISIDMEQRRWDLKGGLDRPLPGFASARLRMGFNEYTHTEFEGEETGTVFDVEAFQTRLELNHVPVNGWEGALGFQYDDEDFLAEGEEAFVPDANTRSWGLFFLEEKKHDRWRFSFGGRVEDTRIDLIDQPENRSFTTWSGSLGAVYNFNDAWLASVNFSRAQRAPSQTELFANGPHVATRTFELGDPDLKRETTHGVDLTLHRHMGSFDFQANVFYNQVDDFIHLGETGMEEDGFPVREYQQTDADFSGFELQAVWEIHDTGAGDFDLRTFYDHIRGELDSGENLPRISPDRLGAGLDWYAGSWRIGVEGYRVRAQDDTAPFEESTDDYTMLNADIAYRFYFGGTEMEAFLRGRNLGDEEARVHTSFLKEFAPLPGRNFALGVRGYF